MLLLSLKMNERNILIAHLLFKIETKEKKLTE